MSHPLFGPDMTPLLGLSLVLRLTAVVWSVLLWRRLRDWRLGFLTGLAGLLLVHKLLVPVSAGLGGDLAGLGVSAMAVLAVAFVERAIQREREVVAARERERAHFERLFESAPEAIVLVDNDSKILRVNSEFTEMFGYGADEAVGRSVDELLAPGERYDEAREVTRSVARGASVSMETVRRRKDGTLLDVSILGTPIRVGSGQIAVYGIYRDVTKWKATLEALRESEQRYRTIVETIEDGYYEVDLNGSLRFFNSALVRLLGYPAERLRGMNNREYMDAENAERVYRTFNEVYTSRASTRAFDWEIIRQDGTRRAVEASVTPVLNADGHPIGFRGIVRDVTERKETERALRESEQRYALAARGANDGLWDWSLTDGTIYYSPRWKNMLGYRDDEIGADPEEWFGRVQERDRERLRAEIQAHLEGPAPHVENEHRIRHRDGTYRWVLCRGVAERDATGRALRMAGSMTDISARKAAEERLMHDAFHDALTGLPNRALFMNLLERSMARLQRREGYQFAVLFLDIDRFKVVNDSLGHMVGDQLLVAAARRLQSCLRPGDTVARLGGDEFTVLLDDIDGLDDADRVAQRIQSELGASFTLHDHEIYTTASIGIALSGSHYRGPEEILRDADTAMYRAKSQGRARHEVFDTDMHASAVTLLRLETDLRRALEREEFRIVYQPIVRLETGTLAGFEALLRWAHPERGLVAPADFIELAEETGLIIPIGEWVLWEACRQMEAWRGLVNGTDRGGPLTVSVNLSPRQFGQEELVAVVADALEVTGLPSDALKLEITESVLMDRAEASVRRLDDLKTLGVQVQVDDFGTGYSSLSYLHRFRLDALKIDRSFIEAVGRAHCEQREIVRTIVTLARNLGMSVVAEGVETAAQRGYLESLGCEYVQGFLYAGPLDDAEAEQLVRNAHRW